VVVFLPKIDGGWIDLLETGAFDLVAEPYRRETIERVIAELSLYRRLRDRERAPWCANSKTYTEPALDLSRHPEA
jgi:hypothetical protein